MRTNTFRLITTFALLVTGIVGCVIFLIGLSQNNYDFLYVYCAILATLIPTTFIFNKKKFDPFEPIVLVTLAIFYGTTLRAIYVTTSENHRADFLMMWSTFDSIVLNMPIMLGGILFLCLGYYSTVPKVNLARFNVFRERGLRPRDPKYMILFCIALGVVGTALYIRAHGIDFSNGVLASSAKRSMELSSAAGETVYAAGMQVFLAKTSQYGFILCFTYMVAGYLRKSPVNMFLLLGSFGVLAFLALISSSRSSIFVLMLAAIIIFSYYRRLKVGLLFTVFVAIAVLVWGMGAIRAENALGQDVVEQGVLDRVFGAGNSIDLIRTSAIIDTADDLDVRLLGSSYASLLTAFIPRSYWPDKPNVSMGAWIKQDLFGVSAKRNGWPPGMIAEAYLNFGTLGILIIMYVFGFLLRVYYLAFQPLLGKSIAATAIYGASTWRLSFGTIGLNFSQGVVQALQFLIPLLLLLMILNRRRRKQAFR